VHYVAAHELRYSFPVDLIRKDGKLAGPWLEKVYPGVHSDIGGGYEPNEQEISNNYARIPMRDMMREALLKGTRLMPYRDIENRDAPLFDSVFACLPDTEEKYKAYISRCNPSGAVEQCIQKHMEQLYSAYGTMHRQGIETVQERVRKDIWRRIGPSDIATELDAYKKARERARKTPAAPILPVMAYKIGKGVYAQSIKPEQWQLNAWESTADKGVVDFIKAFVHDSKGGFLYNLEPFSYFSKRGIVESSRSLHGWAEANIIRPVDSTVEEATDWTREKAEEARKAAEEAKEAAIKKAKEVKDATVEKAKEIKDATVEKAKEVKEVIREKAKEAKEVISETAEKAKEVVSEKIDQAGQWASDAVEQVGNATQKAMDRLKGAWENL
jgi:hypothetical protein